MPDRRSWRPSSSVQSITTCCCVSDENSVHNGGLACGRVCDAIGALQATPEIFNHI
jgi:hypothetical protein